MMRSYIYPLMAALVLPFFIFAQRRSAEQKEQQRVAEYAFWVDSLISSRNYSLYAVTVREMNSGLRRVVFDDLYYLTVEDDVAIVHLPLECGDAASCQKLDLDSVELRRYHAIRGELGWVISFDLEQESSCYNFDVEIPIAFEEVTFTESCDGVAVRYVASFKPPKG